MVNKKAWIKIVEAFFAILLISIAILTIYITKNDRSDEDEINRVITGVLEEMVQNDSMRENIVNNDISGLEGFARERIPRTLNFTIKVCEVDAVCNLDNYRKEVFVRERVIEGTLQEYSPKRLKIFVWKT